MDTNEYLPKLHSDILVIMDEIDRICRDNDLHYYLTGGTLLGAIRHKGFIPWDDDLDIAMPRKDFEKLINIFTEQKCTNLYLRWYSTERNYYHFFAKICLRGTLFEEDSIKNTEYSGIFVDIFPLDDSPAYSSKVEHTKNIIKKIRRIHSSNILGVSNNCVKRLGCKILRLLLGPQQCLNLQMKILQNLSHVGSSHYANFGSQYNIKKQTMPKEWFGTGVYLLFENRKYKCPSHYLSVVRNIFGDSYMKLPPIEKRRTHYPSKVIFSDKSVIKFLKPINRVRFEE